MELSAAKIPTKIRFEVSNPATQVGGIFVTAFTPDAKEWRAAQRQYAPKGQENLSMRVQKGGDSLIDLPSDPNAHDNRIKKFAAITIDIEGFTNGGEAVKLSADDILALYSDDEMAWLVDGVEDKMDDRANFLESTGKIVKSSSDALHGSTQAATEAG